MKRYVKEFANDELRCCTEERKKIIEHTLDVYKRGLITSFEAIKIIVDSYYNQ